MSSLTLIVPFLVALLQPTLSAAFSWHLTTPTTQCSNLTISIAGSDGKPPYRVLVIPSGSTPLANNVDPRAVIDQAFDGDSTSISFPINYPANSHFVAVVSDANGFGTGGASVETVVANSDDTSCFDPNQTWSHSFSYGVGSDNQITQCQPTFVWWDTSNAQGPASFVGVTPGGRCFVLPESNISTDPALGTGFTWTPDIQGGTTVMIVGGDNRGMGTGGSAQFTVQLSNNATCLDPVRPSSTPGVPPSLLQADTSGSTNSGGGGPNVGTIVAAAVGGIIGLMIAIAFIVLSYSCLRRDGSMTRRLKKRTRSESNIDHMSSPAVPRIRPQPSYTRQANSIATSAEQSLAHYSPEPFTFEGRGSPVPSTFAGVGAYNQGYAYRGQGMPPRSRLNSLTSGSGAPMSDTSSQTRYVSPLRGGGEGGGEGSIVYDTFTRKGPGYGAPSPNPVPQTSGGGSIVYDTYTQKGSRHGTSSPLSQGASSGMQQPSGLASTKSGGGSIVYDAYSQKGSRYATSSPLSQGASSGLQQMSGLASTNNGGGGGGYDPSGQKDSRYLAPSVTSSTSGPSSYVRGLGGPSTFPHENTPPREPPPAFTSSDISNNPPTGDVKWKITNA